jgi:hypothetical protein
MITRSGRLRFVSDGDKCLDSEREWLLVDLLSGKALPVYSACPWIHLLFELSIVALHDLNPATCPGLIGHCLPFEAFSF